MLIIRFILFMIIFINFLFRGILFFHRLSKLTYSEQTKHKFRCQSCGKEYYLNGVELKKMKKSSVLITKETPTKTIKYFKTQCPLCGNVAEQEKVFDTNVKYGDMVNVQMDDVYKPLIKDFLLKGVLPILIIIVLR